MVQRKVRVTQIEAGKDGLAHLGERLNVVENNIQQVQTDLTNQITSVQTTLSTEIVQNEQEIAKVNEAVMAMASAPVTTPVFNVIESYEVQTTDIVAGQPTVITIPNGRTYKVGKGNLIVLRNGIVQIPGGDYVETNETQVTFNPDVLLAGDIITFIIGNPSKLNYNVNVTYYTEGADAGKIQTVAYTGDINRTITYTYNAQGKIATETITEDGKTITKTYNYDTNGRLTGVTCVVV
ncbi:MAG: hypothetical protein QXI16_01500 [Sulfolobaceae archaeon]